MRGESKKSKIILEFNDFIDIIVVMKAMKSLQVKLSDEMHRRLKVAAAREGLTLGDFLEKALERIFRKEKQHEG